MKVVPVIKKTVVFILSFYILYSLQTAFFHYFELAGVVPNLMVVLTSFYGFMRNRKEGMWAGFVSGILLDLSYGSLFGVHTFILLIIGYLNGLFRKVFYGDDVKLPILFVGISDLLYGGAMYVFYFVPRQRTNVNFYLMNIMIPEAIYTIMVSFVLYFIYYRLFLWLDREERKVEHIL